MSLRIRLTECNEVDHKSKNMVNVLFKIHSHYVGNNVKNYFKFFASGSAMDIAIFYRCQFIHNMEFYKLRLPFFILEL